MKNELLNIALSQYGVTEIVGNQHNPTVLNYFHEIGHKWVTTDETAWCSAFANWVALQAGKERSSALDARSWLKVGTPTQNPQQGDIVVYWREDPKSWKGHVGFFIGYSEDQKFIYTLGGNQRNRVCIAPYATDKLLGFRTLATNPKS